MNKKYIKKPLKKQDISNPDLCWTCGDTLTGRQYPFKRQCRRCFTQEHKEWQHDWEQIGG